MQNKKRIIIISTISIFLIAIIIYTLMSLKSINNKINPIVVRTEIVRYLIDCVHGANREIFQCDVTTFLRIKFEYPDGRGRGSRIDCRCSANLEYADKYGRAYSKPIRSSGYIIYPNETVEKLRIKMSKKFTKNEPRPVNDESVKVSNLSCSAY